MIDKLILLAGIVLIAMLGVAGMVSIEWLRPEGHNAQLDTEITGLVTLIAGQLFSQRLAFWLKRTGRISHDFH